MTFATNSTESVSVLYITYICDYDLNQWIHIVHGTVSAYCMSIKAMNSCIALNIKHCKINLYTSICESYSSFQILTDQCSDKPVFFIKATVQYQHFMVMIIITITRKQNTLPKQTTTKHVVSNIYCDKV